MSLRIDCVSVPLSSELMLHLRHPFITYNPLWERILKGKTLFIFGIWRSSLQILWNDRVYKDGCSDTLPYIPKLNGLIILCFVNFWFCFVFVLSPPKRSLLGTLGVLISGSSFLSITSLLWTKKPDSQD